VRCDLMLMQREEVLVAARAISHGAGIDVSIMQPPAPPSAQEAALSVISYVRRTRAPVIVDDAAESSIFSSDEYIAKARMRSLMCVPIARQSALVGLLYLENNLARGAFTREGLKLLEVLSTQAAISLENAALYEDVARERQRAEDALRDKL